MLNFKASLRILNHAWSDFMGSEVKDPVKNILQAQWTASWLLAATLGLSACDGPSEKFDDVEALNGGSGPFFVYSVTGTSFKTLDRVDANGKILPKVDSLDYSKSWNLPKARHLTFQACIKSRSTRKPVVGRTFTVSDGRKSFAANGPSSDAGCFWWKEVIGFNYFADSKYLELKREINGTGDFKGGRSVKFYVNPWASYRDGDRDQEVVFKAALPEVHVVRGQSASRKALAGDGQRYPLFMANLKMKATKLGNINSLVNGKKESYSGFMLDLNLQMKPQVKVKGFDINQEPIGLRHGRFKVWAHLLATDVGNLAKESLVLSHDPNQAPYHIQNIDPRTGILTVSIKMPITRAVSDGRIKLIMRVKAMGGPASSQLDDFESIYVVGEFDNLRGDKEPTFSPDDHTFANGEFNFSFDDYLQRMDPGGFQRLKDLGFAFDKKPYVFKKTEQRWLRIQPGETATVRTVEYRASTCLYDPGTGQLQKRLKFLVTRIRDSKAYPQHPVTNANQEIMTDDFGCLSWTDEVTHQYYKPEKPLSPSVLIRRQGMDGNYFEQVLKLKINPWDDKFTFGEDDRQLGVDYIKSLENLPQIESRFYLTGFQYYTTGFRYEVDKYLNLLVKKTVLLRMLPKVLRYSSIVNGRKQVEPLRDGIYLMKVALEKNYLDPAMQGPMIDKHDYDHHIPRTSPGVEGYSLRMGTTERSKTYFDLVTKFVKVQQGNIITPIEFTMRDLRLMRIRTQFLVQLETIHEPAFIIANNVADKWLMKDIKSIKKKIKNLREQRKEVLERDDGVDLNKEERHAVMVASGAIHGKIDTLRKILKSKLLNMKLELERLLDRLVQTPAYSSKYLGRYLRELEMGKDDKAQYLGDAMKNLFHPKLADSLDGKINATMPEEAYINEPFSGSPANGGSDLTQLQKLSLEAQSLELNCDSKMSVNFAMENPKFVRCLLSSMKIPKQVIDSVAEKVEESDSTNEPTEIYANYSLLVDHDSGLRKRSFVGPLTLLLNSNASFVRATDRLDEFFCKKVDCSAGSEGEVSNSYPNMDRDQPIIDQLERDIILDQTYYDNDAERLDASRIDNAAYEQSRYFGSIRHLYKKNIDDLIDDYNYKDARRNYTIEMEYSRLIYNYLNTYELRYVSLTDSSLLRFKGNDKKCNKLTVDDCTTTVIPSEDDRIVLKQDFLDALNRPIESSFFASKIDKVTEYDLLHLIRYVYDRDLSENEKKEIKASLDKVGLEELNDHKKNGKGLIERASDVFNNYRNYLFNNDKSLMLKDEELVKKKLKPGLGERLCRLFYDDLGSDRVEFKDRSATPTSNSLRSGYLKACLEKIWDGQVSEVFTFDRKLNIKKVGEYRYKGGKQLNIRVSSGSFFREQDVSYFSKGVSLTADTGFSKQGIIKSLIGFSAALAGRVSVDGESSVRTVGGSGVEDAAYLVMQTAAFDLEILNHEKCIIIRHKAQFLVKTGVWNSETLEGLNSIDRERLLGGYFICEGKRGSSQTWPTAIRERYYYLTQHFTQGDMLDNADLYNLPFNLGFRGAEGLRLMYSAIYRNEEDFNAIYGKKDELTNPEINITEIETLLTLIFRKNRDETEPLWPLKKLVDAYLNFRPSFPGLYTVIDELTEQPSYPWPSDPRQSFDRGLIRSGWGLYDGARSQAKRELFQAWDLARRRGLKSEVRAFSKAGAKE